MFTSGPAPLPRPFFGDSCLFSASAAAPEAAWPPAAAAFSSEAWAAPEAPADPASAPSAAAGVSAAAAEFGSRALASTSCTSCAAASTASSEPRSTTFLLPPSPSSTCKSSRPLLLLMWRTVAPPLPMTTLPSFWRISTSRVVLLVAELITDSTAFLALSTEPLAPTMRTACAFLSTAMETSWACSTSRTLPAPLAVSDRTPLAETFSIVSTQPRSSWIFWISVLAASFSASPPVISREDSLPRRATCSLAPVEVCTASRRSVLQSFACSKVNFTDAGTLLASVTHSSRTTFHFSTLSLSPTSSTPFAFLTTVRPDVSRSSANLEGLAPSAPLPLPLPLPLTAPS
mmetsp:Transcript_51111/g.163612  ORF Transcript_51111/g.163612 Transcript_51111/m.163612 type:complete len:345 (-) Transcript_51111:1418-2452(-)